MPSPHGLPGGEAGLRARALRSRARAGLATLSIASTLLAATLLPSGVVAQSRYPASDRGAPAGVYSAPRIAIDSLAILLQKDPSDYGANWRMAGALMTLGALAGDAGRVGTRDAQFAEALSHARRAVQAEPDRAEGHYMVAQLLGRMAQASRFRDRFRNSSQILAESRAALQADSLHDGAWHQLGRWHTAVAGLSKIERLFATYALGGEGMAEASWEQGVAALERAVKLRPSWISYRLDLAHAYVGQGRYKDAQEQLKAIAKLQQVDPEDAIHVRQATNLTQWVGRRTGELPREKISLAMLLRR
jgi:tetratricopeptide (TPR) repeat protein